MRGSVLLTLLGGLILPLCSHAADGPILGFGSASRGGARGRVLWVTRKDDDAANPKPGSLRWALKEKGPRIVKFAVSGDIILENRIIIREPYLTVDGSDAPGDGVCIRNGSLMFRDAHDVMVRYVRIRLGEEPAKRQRRELHTARPAHSAGLDCVSLDDARRIVFDHCSLSWSCDEIFGITHCREVTLQWCILSSPLANPKLHPYGDRHACPINASATDLTVHHCLMAHYVMRGPQFEANDMRPQDRFPVRMEAVNNVMFDYERSGSRYGCGVEKKSGTAAGKTFQFQFINNLYLSDSAEKPPIEAIAKHGVIPNVKVYVAGNVQKVSTRSGTSSEPVRPPFWTAKEEGSGTRTQVSRRPLFGSLTSQRATSAEQAAEEVLQSAGCSLHRDRIDRRVIEDVRRRRFEKVAHSEPGFFSRLGF